MWTVTINPKEYWISTGITVEKNRAYKFAFNNVRDWRDNWVPADPESGWRGAWKTVSFLAALNARCKRAPMYAVVGAIDKKKSSYFPIRSRDVYTPRQNGELFLFVNDWKDHYDNNRGECELFIFGDKR
jgi:hypothetical protein